MAEGVDPQRGTRNPEEMTPNRMLVDVIIRLERPWRGKMLGDQVHLIRITRVNINEGVCIFEADLGRSGPPDRGSDILGRAGSGGAPGPDPGLGALPNNARVRRCHSDR